MRNAQRHSKLPPPLSADPMGICNTSGLNMPMFARAAKSPLSRGRVADVAIAGGSVFHRKRSCQHEAAALLLVLEQLRCARPGLHRLVGLPLLFEHGADNLRLVGMGAD